MEKQRDGWEMAKRRGVKSRPQAERPRTKEEVRERGGAEGAATGGRESEREAENERQKK